MGALKKVLIANRGEIALRIIRALRELSIPSVAIYSEVDENHPFVLEADEAYPLGDPTPQASYLNIPKIIDIAIKAGCDGIHPGYGFLAENPTFAKKTQEAGLTFIGPTPETIAWMGDKLKARKLAQEAGVPVVPGSEKPLSPKEALRVAKMIGFPVLIKAAAGGGGKGMHRVDNPEELKGALETSQRESASAFGDPRVYLEKYLPEPHHIEVQILGDYHGNILHFYERECSIQRRHQKIIEESPSPTITPEERERVTQLALALAKKVGYTSAGTVEFLYSQGSFYFLEMNTRIQVEHPVTEMTCGVDLVKWQIRLAGGTPLPWKQEDIMPRGNAIECRIYAEDPTKNFLPAPGELLWVEEPKGMGIRIDSGVRTGITIPPQYDPILSKVITWGEDRQEAIQKMIWTLENTCILGTPTNIPFLLDILKHPAFQKGKTSTHFIPDHLASWKPHISEDMINFAFALASLPIKKAYPFKASTYQDLPTPWNTLGRWRL